VVHAPWPEDYENIETGDFRTDVTKLRATTGWHPRVEFREGISRMVEYYKRHLKEYLA
jgi:nucleoside-diphosphate-sugar epimerase